MKPWSDDSKWRLVNCAVDLPIEKFSQLVKNLTSFRDLNIIITGDEKEKEICNIIAGTTNAFNLSGKSVVGRVHQSQYLAGERRIFFNDFRNIGETRFFLITCFYQLEEDMRKCGEVFQSRNLL